MNKTLPENIADLAFQFYSEEWDTTLIDPEYEGIADITVEDHSDEHTVDMQVEIKINGKVLSLATDIPKAFYRPYLNDELAACLLENAKIFCGDRNHVFMDEKRIDDFCDEMNQLFLEDEE